MLEHGSHSVLLYLSPNIVDIFCSPSEEYSQILFSLVLKVEFTSISNLWPERDMVSISGNKDTGDLALVHQ